MGCGAAVGEKSAAEQLSRTALPELESNANLLDEDLFEEVWDKYDTEDLGYISSKKVKKFCEIYSGEKRIRIEKEMKGRTRPTSKELKMISSLEELASSAKTHSETLLKQMNIEEKGAVLKDPFHDKFTALIYKLNGQTPRAVSMDEGLVETLWGTYDVNGDGDLSAAEMTHLLKDYAAAKSEKLEMQSMTHTGKTVMSDNIKVTLAAINYMVEHVDHYGKMLVDSMDVNGDGDVNKEEFTQKFPQVWQKLINDCKKHTKAKKPNVGDTEKKGSKQPSEQHQESKQPSKTGSKQPPEQKQEFVEAPKEEADASKAAPDAADVAPETQVS